MRRYRRGKGYAYMNIMFFIFALSVLSSPANAGQPVDTHLRKSANEIWTVEYTTADPVNKLGFRRNPDQSRIERWQPTSEEFEIVFSDTSSSVPGAQGEYIVRKDRRAFTRVIFTLTPTYRHLSKDYAPFSPFSAGGLLFHSGRFFACVDECTDSDNDWKMALTIPVDEHVVINGAVLTGSIEWHDRDSGKSVYVGKQPLIVTEHVIAVIDEGLPEQIKTSLSSQLPEMMRYFENHFGALPSKPMLFASYAKNAGSRSSQGGTLPDQIFMHWDYDNLEERLKEPTFVDDTSWFFAHEAAHLYQNNAVSTFSIDPNQSWIHEGNAEMLASLALLSISPESANYVRKRIDRAKVQCTSGLQDFPLVSAADEQRFDLYYSCGLLIHRVVDFAVRNEDKTKDGIYSVWNEYQAQIKSGKPANQDTFIAVVSELVTKQTTNRILDIVASKLENPAEFMDAFTISN